MFIYMDLFQALPEKFFSPLAFASKNHYARLLLAYYRLFTDYQGRIERLLVVREFEDYFSGVSAEEIDSDELGEELADESASDPRFLANVYLRRLISYGWLTEEILDDFTQLVNMTSWSRPFFEALYTVATGSKEEYESHIVAVYSLLSGKAASENGHYNVINALQHTRRLIESLKVLSQNIKTFLQSLYTEETGVKEILHIHYDLYMHEVIDRAYTRLKTSDNLSKYRPLINHAVSEFLQNKEWLSANSVRLAAVRSLPEPDARKLLTDMLKEIRDSLRSIDPILDEIDDKNRRYSKISTEKIKSRLYSNATLQGKLRDITRAIADEHFRYQELRTGLLPAGFLGAGSLYTKPKPDRDMGDLRIPDADEDNTALLLEQEMEMKIKNQLNPAKIGRHLKSLQAGPGEPVPAADIAVDLKGFIRTLYSASYAEAGRDRFPFRVRWETGDIKIGPFHFQNHTYIEDRKHAE
ncbi:MAG: hypothetical protein HN368_22190 [Spirochaetales bacterium]|jgi:hypothetical protein|nr:hypothetical protein [Spirochaetales bacterium]